LTDSTGEEFEFGSGPQTGTTTPPSPVDARPATSAEATGTGTGTVAGRTTFAEVFRLPEYRSLWAAQLLSLIGDELAVVALTWLVFDRSHSPLLAAAAYAISFAPWLIGGPFLSGLADRLPRREVMVVADLLRCGLMVVMATVGLPIWALFVLLFCSELLAPPFNAARAAVLPDVLPGDRYVVGTAIGNITNQFGMVLGFAVGGSVVAVLHPMTSLGLNAVTFAFSAALLRFGLRPRPVDREDGPAARWTPLRDAVAGVRLVFGRADLRMLTGFAVLSALYVVPEGLIVPYTTRLGGGPVSAGFLLAAAPAGAVLGSALYSRWVSPSVRLEAMGSLAVATCLPLVACALRPGMAWTLVLFAVSGAAGSYQLAANAAFVGLVPERERGQAFGLVQTLMSVGQGGAILLAGALAERWPPTWVIAVAGLLGSAAAVLLAVCWRALPAARSQAEW
jgi:MFS family permease